MGTEWKFHCVVLKTETYKTLALITAHKSTYFDYNAPSGDRAHIEANSWNHVFTELPMLNTINLESNTVLTVIQYVQAVYTIIMCFTVDRYSFQMIIIIHKTIRSPKHVLALLNAKIGHLTKTFDLQLKI